MRSLNIIMMAESNYHAMTASISPLSHTDQQCLGSEPQPNQHETLRPSPNLFKPALRANSDSTKVIVFP